VNAASRISELEAISASTVSAAKVQEAGRRNQELDSGLASMQALVDAAATAAAKDLGAQQADLAAALCELEGGNACLVKKGSI
jgi:hypothetical protein